MLNCRALTFVASLVILGGFILSLAGLIPRPSLQVAGAIIAGTPTASPTSTSEPAPTSSPTPRRTGTPQPTRTSVAAATLVPTRPSTSPGQAKLRRVVEHFLFGRPLVDNAPGAEPDWHYLYGTTELTEYEVHHGVDFPNPFGTSVLAVGDGTIVSAADDRDPLCGENGAAVCGRFLKFYGLVVVMQLDETYRGQTLYALYGHLDRIDVQIGQVVKRGDLIGKVGMTGIAIGPHTQFEIRLGVNDYASTRNPMLWIRPLPGRGVLAGRYTDQKDNFIHAAIIDIYRADAPNVLYRETETYSRDNQPDVNSDDDLGENFLLNDLPAGEYVVRVAGKPYATHVRVSEGRLAFVEVGVPK